MQIVCFGQIHSQELNIQVEFKKKMYPSHLFIKSLITVTNSSSSLRVCDLVYIKAMIYNCKK